MKALSLLIFVAILGLTLWITWWTARRTRTTRDFYAADSQLTAVQNGFALAGAWFPIVNPAILSMPIGFPGAILGAWLGGRNPAGESHFDEVLFRAQTGDRAA